MARTNHNYYEFRNKTSKLLSWQIEREETDRLRHSDVKDDGRSLFSNILQGTVSDKNGVENTKATTLLNFLILPKLDPNKRDCLDVNMSENAVMPWVSSTIKLQDQMAFHLNILNPFSEKLLTYQTSILKEDLTKKTIPSSLELKTITLLPKPGKDLVSLTACLAF